MHSAARLTPAGLVLHRYFTGATDALAKAQPGWRIPVLPLSLFDIDTLINRTLVYGASSACILALYVGVVSGVGLVFQMRANAFISLCATVVVILAIQPLREWLQRGVNRLLYGQREEPYAVHSELGRRLETTFSPDETLSTVAETVAQTLKLPQVSVALREGETETTAASVGVPTARRSHSPCLTSERRWARCCFAHARPMKAGLQRSGACTMSSTSTAIVAW